MRLIGLCAINCNFNSKSRASVGAVHTTFCTTHGASECAIVTLFYTYYILDSCPVTAEFWDVPNRFGKTKIKGLAMAHPSAGSGQALKLRPFRWRQSKSESFNSPG